MRAQVWVYLPAWRWCVFAAAVAPVGYATRIAMHGAVLLIESRSLANHAALYYLVAIRVRPAVRICFSGLFDPVLSGSDTLCHALRFTQNNFQKGRPVLSLQCDDRTLYYKPPD